MINTQTLARPYAKAAFEFASAAGQTDSWSKMLNLAAVAVEVPEVAAFDQREQGPGAGTRTW